MTSISSDRVNRLRAAAKRKSEDAQARARRALVALETRGLPVNFNSVASEAGVSKGFLYSNPDIRHQITERRRQPAPRLEASERTARSKEASIAVKLAVASNVIRQLRAENEQLRNENATLRGDLLTERRKVRLQTNRATS